ncbi:MAG: glycosyl hydrolase 108 family protein [Alphaproteobacteria bacterium]
MDKNLHTYLINEYKRALEEPLYVKINDKDVLVPFVYALKYSSEKEATDNFKVDFFNHTDENVYAIMSPYEAHQKEPKFVWFDNIQFPVPYEARNLSEAEQKDYILADCFKRYDNAVKAHLLAKELKLNPKFVQIETSAFNQLKKEILQKKKELQKPQTPRPAPLPRKKPQPTAVLRQNKTGHFKFNRKIAIGLAAGSILFASWFSKCSQKRQDKIQDKQEQVSKPKKGISSPEERFKNVAAALLGEEGGYATKKQIDQETHYGVINSTLENFKKNYPKYADQMPEKLKDLTKENALTIIRVGFYEQYKIDQIKNESIAKLMLDIAYNHDYETMRGFLKQGYCAVLEYRGEDIEKRPRNLKDMPEFVNSCNNKEGKIFVNAIKDARLKFLDRKLKENPDAYQKYEKGLRKRYRKAEYIPQEDSSIDWNYASQLAMIDQGRK